MPSLSKMIVKLLFHCGVFHAVLSAKLDASTPLYDTAIACGSAQRHLATPLNRTRCSNSVNTADIRFMLYTRWNSTEFQILNINDSDALHKSNFVLGKKVKLVCHGWQSSGNGEMAQSIKKAYLSASDLNIVVVDWSKIADHEYLGTSHVVINVGRLVGQFLKFLISEGVSVNDIHLIGHSLGAHVVGIAGDYVKMNNMQIDGITGLDPARPFFSVGEMDCLSKDDARHVEVIHTCGRFHFWWFNRLGFAEPIGHIDYYPNYGYEQPGCNYDWAGECSHSRSYNYFAESITSDVPFIADHCGSFKEIKDRNCKATGERLTMGGLDLHYGKYGIYYLKTNAKPPYAIRDPENSD